MKDFWRLAKHMLERKSTVVLAVIFVFISAAGLGVGLLAMVPMLKLILGDGKSLVILAREYNATGPAIPVPTPIIAVLPTDRFGGVALAMGVILVLTVVGGAANYMHQYLSQTLASTTIGRIRQQAFDRVIQMPLGLVVTRGPSTLVARIIRDAAALDSGFVALTRKSMAHVTKGCAAGMVAVIIDWKLTAVALICLPVLAIALRKLGKRIRRGFKGSLRAQEQLLRVTTESLQGMRAVKANTAEELAVARFRVHNEEAVKQELRMRTARALSGPLMESLAVFVVGGVAMIAARLIIAGVIPFEQFLVTLTALAMAGATFRPLAGFINELQAATAPAERLIEILDAPIEVGGSIELGRHAVSLEFDSITFTYEGTETPAVADVSLNIMHGERVAIVGPNGCGKTTLLGMVPRLLIPQSGVVRVDGTDIATVELKSYRRQIGVVTQETVLFRGSIADNIAFGTLDVSREQIIEAARRAHAHDFIEAISGGYDADVAEQGASLSGGQRQRIAIARAILRDPAILILDEATSQIDAESEAEINAALAEFCSGRTSLVIAHRLSTVLQADRIVVMGEGRIIDQGTHAHLLERCELYARLIRTQLVEMG